MLSPYELFVGLRYTRAKRKNHFISFISITSMLGIGLGVAALIVVLSVMNGFQKELRATILGVVSHIQIAGMGGRLADWPVVDEQARSNPEVIASAPYVMAEGLLSHGRPVQGTIVRGIIPELEATVAEIGEHMRQGSLETLVPGKYRIALGIDLARSLRASVGDRIVLIAPQGQVTPAGILPRLRQFTVSGVFELKNYQYDSGLALVHLEDAKKLFHFGDAVSGIRLKVEDLFAAPRIARELANTLPTNVYVADWTRSHANFFRAVQIEKRAMFIILLLIVAVAAFNIVSTLVMAVTDKRADIAILRTLGAAPSDIMKIFIIQGALIGVIGTLTGLLLGVAIATNIDVIVPAIENTLGFKFLAKDVYYIDDLPSELLAADVMVIGVTAFVLTLLATIYPSFRAARTNPAEALRYE
ncbi:MAG: lipoprotein-releasing ABC transporter permease subunit [Betaproteobacteria bacterium]|jgi:lipoprotein-releasing system permease protein|nr:MAG: lipoprotein-releasing ABC transporter permease subunit [Betaproteobacteria bacterium]